MTFSQRALDIFSQATSRYHILDSVDQPVPSTDLTGIEAILFRKNWIDAVQWHMEDLIRDPEIDPAKGMELKRLIDRSNQNRTDMVERIDDYFLEFYNDVPASEEAQINTESPAWALDRLSILVLKIWHMKDELARPEASVEHKEKCQKRLNVLLEQEIDLVSAIDTLLDDYAHGRKIMKVYRQMKMYNDAETNPVLRNHKEVCEDHTKH